MIMTACYKQLSTYPNSEDAEWSTEGVQVGGVGSAVGVLGLWTGAEHERTDPLGRRPFWNQCYELLIEACFAGPFWMWKVAETES